MRTIFARTFAKSVFRFIGYFRLWKNKNELQLIKTEDKV